MTDLIHECNQPLLIKKSTQNLNRMSEKDELSAGEHEILNVAKFKDNGHIYQRIVFNGTDGLRHTNFKRLYTEDDMHNHAKKQRKLCYDGALLLLGDHAEGHEGSVATHVKNAPEPKPD